MTIKSIKVFFILFVGLIGFRNLDAQLANTPWPMFHHDLQHTGRSPYIGPATPQLKWSCVTGNYLSFSSPTIGFDGTLYVGSSDSNLYAIDSMGSIKWSYKTGDYVISSPAIGYDSTIYVLSWDSKLYAINPDGSLKWSFVTVGSGWYQNSSPAIDSAGIIYFGSSNFKLYAINPDGSLKWSYQTDFRIASSPAIDPLNGVIYLGCDAGKVYAINYDGVEKWSYQTGSQPNPAPAIGSDRTVYIGAYNHKLYALNPDSGTLKWSYQTGGMITTSCPAIGYDETIYVGSYDRKLYAMNPDGSVKWSFLTGERIGSSPAIDFNGTIYIGSSDSNLYAINSDGSLKWSYLTGAPIYSSPTIGSDGTIYVQGSDSLFYAIGPGFGSIQEETGTPKTYGLTDCFPNPIVNKGIIKYQILAPTADFASLNNGKSKVSLALYDITGSCVKTLVNEEKQAGSYSVNFDAKGLTTGIYFVKLKTDNYRETKKLILMR
ncbi:MAG: PQQ-binding-like beta-propeller repeat protein [bacterium]|nr:PQQ-binding-like beta-propeller repeat protein [bacterium]